jgi:hypothetical protein
MQNKRTNLLRTGIGQVLALSLILSFSPLKAGMALGLPLISSSKKPSLQSAGYEKLTAGDGPTTNDVAAVPVAAPHGQINSDGVSLPDELKPMTLHDQDNNGEATDGTDASGSLLKSGVSTTDYVPKEGDSNAMRAKSINKDDPKNLVKQAGKVGLGPVQLVESEEETNKKVDAILTAEQMELADLWEATLSKSPDIQFVVQKLQPTSNPAHLSTILTRMLSTAAFGGMGAVAMMSPNPGTYAFTSAGGSMIQQVLGMKERSDAKRAKLSQEEELVMFKMVQDTCNRMVDAFRDYKKNFVSLTRASSDLVDLKGMVAEAHSGQDSAKQLEMEYTLRKQQRDIDAVAEEVRRHRLTLVDMAGPEAVEKLDKQLQDEQNKVNTVANAPGSDAEESKQAVGQAEENQAQAKASGDVNLDGQTQELQAEKKPAEGQPEEIQIDQSSTEKQEPKRTASSNPSPQS